MGMDVSKFIANAEPGTTLYDAKMDVYAVKSNLDVWIYGYSVLNEKDFVGLVEEGVEDWELCFP